MVLKSDGSPNVLGIIITVLLVIVTGVATWALTKDSMANEIGKIASKNTTELAIAKSERANQQKDIDRIISLIVSTNQSVAESNKLMSQLIIELSKENR